MTATEFQREMSSKGCNCAQIVFSYFAEKNGLDINKALKITSAFGGGMGKGDVCGAITGAYMALGLIYGNDLENSDRSILKEKIKEFDLEFQKISMERRCEDILGVNVGDKEKVMEFAKKNPDFKAICPKLVINSINIIEKLEEK
ncbi:C-GCAxxG-C-C family protein [Lagierella massiliensis]|uniref:C-GCAxxG-C-C family protein n=1 Tax=Lagierella massiliensis TaxID=1689303 RepID=UPI0006D823E1|nr:C-GCAxxG-C-C family protein [Lagierella massiliensis]